MSTTDDAAVTSADHSSKDTEVTGLSPNSIAIRQQLASLPRLQNAVVETRTCKICAASAKVFDVVDFNKFCSTDFYAFGLSRVYVTYYQCTSCAFVFTNFFDDWSITDFARFVYNEDYPIIDAEYAETRPISMAAQLSALLDGCKGARLLDYGSGSGRFAAEMGVRGFGQVATYDPFSAPMRPEGKFDVITCFEAIEHSVDPLGMIGDMKGVLAEDGAIIISQSLQPPNIDELRGNWWYVAPRNGHVSMFAEDTLSLVAIRSELVLYLGEGLYGLSRPRLSDQLKGAMARLGPTAARSVLLSAPAEDHKDWNECEVHGLNTRFRWTRSSQIEWPRRPFAPGSTRIRIPFLMQIVPGFATNCRVFFEDNPLPTEASQTQIIARLELEASMEAGIKLITPGPFCPRELSGSPDARRLGLAVPISG